MQVTRCDQCKSHTRSPVYRIQRPTVGAIYTDVDLCSVACLLAYATDVDKRHKEHMAAFSGEG